MELVQDRARDTDDLAEFVGVPLTVVFASLADLNDARRDRAGRIALAPPFHISDEDLYLVIPDDIGLELADILRDGDGDLLAEALRDGLVVEGSVERKGRGQLFLDVERTCNPQDLVRGRLPFTAHASLEDCADLCTVNVLPHLQCTLRSKLFDEEGFDCALRHEQYVGPSWRASGADAGADPTCIWSQQGPTGVGVLLALFQEYEELIVLFQPLLIEASRR